MVAMVGCLCTRNSSTSTDCACFSAMAAMMRMVLLIGAVIFVLTSILVLAPLEDTLKEARLFLLWRVLMQDIMTSLIGCDSRTAFAGRTSPNSTSCFKRFLLMLVRQQLLVLVLVMLVYTICSSSSSGGGGGYAFLLDFLLVMLLFLLDFLLMLLLLLGSSFMFLFY